MKLVIIESPYQGDIAPHVEYARACIRHSLYLGESPIASHLLYTQPGVLIDAVPHLRRLGIEAGLAWVRVAELMAVYEDLGISSGMQDAIEEADRANLKVEYRNLSVEKTL